MSDESGEESDENTNFLGTYEGERDELGGRHGNGKAVLPNKDTYSGQYGNGVRQGFGVYQVIRKGKVVATYEGEWSQGERSGYGICKYEDGSEYNGYWEKNLRNGRGTMKFGNGQEYSGLWKAGLREDMTGLIKFPGSIHIGGWKAGVMDGPGVIIYEAPASAVCLISTWEYGKPQGRGIVVREKYFLEGNILPDGTWRTSSHLPIADIKQALGESQFKQLWNAIKPYAQICETGFALQYERFLQEASPDLWKCTNIGEIANTFIFGKTWKGGIGNEDQGIDDNTGSPTSQETHLY